MIKAVLPMPPTSNNAYANTPMGRVKTSGARAYANSVAGNLMAQGYTRKHAMAMHGNLAFFATFYFERKGKVDVANREKILVDAMMKHLGLDDSYIVFMQLKKRYDKHSPRCEVVLRSATEGER